MRRRESTAGVLPAGRARDRPLGRGKSMAVSLSGGEA